MKSLDIEGEDWFKVVLIDVVVIVLWIIEREL